MEVPMGFELGNGSLKKLEGVHADLVRVVKRAIQITSVDFTVVEGKRSAETQAKYLAAGTSKTLNSRHLTGDAVDLIPWLDGADPYPRKGDSKELVAEKLARFDAIAKAMFEAADELGIALQWGNDWDMDGVPTAKDPDEKGQLTDYPHFQLPWPYNVAKAKEAAKRRASAKK